jgi:hypothetical protein
MNNFVMTPEIEKNMRREIIKGQVSIGDLLKLKDEEINNLGEDAVYDYIERIRESDKQKSDLSVKNLLIKLMERGTRLLDNNN